MRTFRISKKRLYPWEVRRGVRREWKSLDTHRASDRENKILQEQNANTMHSSKVPVLASGWRERSQKPHPKIARQVALVESQISQPTCGATAL